MTIDCRADLLPSLVPNGGTWRRAIVAAIVVRPATYTDHMNLRAGATIHCESLLLGPVAAGHGSSSVELAACKRPGNL
ncbi:MAG: hypothetical protein KDA63_18705 [Planctomycetales bacterium]|nr:hypothetical protein [Planctomycetales bacterium]